MGEDAIEDQRLVDCLRRTGNHEELVRLSLRGIERHGADSRGAEQLKLLQREAAVPVHLKHEVENVVQTLGRDARRSFEERAQAWVAQARSEIDQRFARTWGFGLGTTSCAVAIYDSVTQRALLCPWRGQEQFASTLSLDRQGNELVGLTTEETLANWLIGHIAASKRYMGRRTVFKIRDHTYQPEEVAARLVRHARGLVESFLAARIRERVGELASAELGEIREEWLSWLEQHHNLRLDRPRALVTIPAYFTNNQKQATGPRAT